MVKLMCAKDEKPGGQYADNVILAISTFGWVQCFINYRWTQRNWTSPHSWFILAVQPIHSHSSWKTWLHQAWSNCGNNETTVSPVAIPEVVTRLLKSLSKQRGLKLNMCIADRKQDVFSFWTTPWLLSPTKPFENIQACVLPRVTLICSRQGQDTQQRQWQLPCSDVPNTLRTVYPAGTKTSLWRLSATWETFIPCCRGLRSLADWPWTGGKSSSGSSGCRPPPRLYRSKLSSSGHWDPRWGTKRMFGFCVTDEAEKAILRNIMWVMGTLWHGWWWLARGASVVHAAFEESRKTSSSGFQRSRIMRINNYWVSKNLN